MKIFDIRRAVGGGGSATHVAHCNNIHTYFGHWCDVLPLIGGRLFRMPRGEDAKRQSLLRLGDFDLYKKFVDILSLFKRNVLISPLEGEKKFLSELGELSNKGRLGILAQREAGFEPSPFSGEVIASVISSDFKSKILVNNENILPRKELSALVPQYLSNFSDTVFSRFTSHFSHKRTAFTLAEVLITLGIIGVVAALTLPSLIQKQQDKATVSRLEKIYSVLSQASLYAREEHGDFEDWNIIDNNQASTRENFAYFEPYLKILRKCDNKSGCWAEQTQSLSGQKARWSDNYKMGVDYISITLNDGINVVYDFAEPSLNYVYGLPSYVNKSYIVFLVDVNGNRRPNKWGRDIFAFILGPNGIIPAGIGNNSANCDPNKKSDVAGYDCAYRVLKEKAIKY